MSAVDLTRAFLANYAAHWAEEREADFVRKVKAISMLGFPTIALLRLFGRPQAWCLRSDPMSAAQQ
jgi:hypothetical protein